MDQGLHRRGATFSAPALIATGDQRFGAVALAADGQGLVALVADSDGVVFRRLPFAGPDPRRLQLDPRDSAFASKLVVQPDGRMVAVNTLSASPADENWRVFTGGDPLDINAWPAAGRVRNTAALGFGTRLAAGPRGVYLMQVWSEPAQVVRPQRPPMSLRSFDFRRQRWRAGRSAFKDQELNGDVDLAQDAAGRLHVARAHRRSDGSCLVYARTGPRASSWFGRTTVLWRTRRDDREAHGLRVAAAPDGRGVAVWHDSRNRVSAIALRQAPGRYRPISNPFDRPECPRRG